MKASATGTTLILDAKSGVSFGILDAELVSITSLAVSALLIAHPICLISVYPAQRILMAVELAIL